VTVAVAAARPRHRAPAATATARRRATRPRALERSQNCANPDLVASTLEPPAGPATESASGAPGYPSIDPGPSLPLSTTRRARGRSRTPQEQEELIAEYIEQVVGAAPPLTEEQRLVVGGVLRGRMRARRGATIGGGC